MKARPKSESAKQRLNRHDWSLLEAQQQAATSQMITLRLQSLGLAPTKRVNVRVK